MASRWAWSVEERWTVTGRGVVVIGEQTGETPTMGERCIVSSGPDTAECEVRGFEMLNFARDAPENLRRHGVGMLLGGIDIADVPIGSVVLPKADDWRP